MSFSFSDAYFDSPADDLPAIAAEQRREIMTAKAIDDDLNFAFDLQLQEAIRASLPSQQQAPIPAAADPRPLESSSHIDILAGEFQKLHQELEDKAVCEMEFKKLKADLHRRVHDYQVAREVDEMEDEDWEEWGDNFERPFTEGAFKGFGDEFRVYFKGLFETETSNRVSSGGIGVAICDSRDELLFEMRKPILGSSRSHNYAEMMALIEALSISLELELKRVAFFCSYYPALKFVNGSWKAKQRKVAELVNQAVQLMAKFTSTRIVLVAGNEMKFAFKLAREAVVSQAIRAAESSSSSVPRETCRICMEEKTIAHIFVIEDCLHRYCFLCMKQHAEVKLLHGFLPTCPHDGCRTALTLDSCSKILTPKLIEILGQRIKEAAIPAADKVYCPYPKCSALMSVIDLPGGSKIGQVGAERAGARQCIACYRFFCINCKVPWHERISCFQYMSMNPGPLREVARLKTLASEKRWRQCVKCSHMIELATGCYHITCRCGYEFCYTCGAEWRKGKATCKCPLWDEDILLQEDVDQDEDEDDDEEGDFW